MEHKLRRTDRELVYRGSVLDIYKDTMELPNGKHEYWDFVDHRKGGACIVPVLPDGRILMVRQYRPVIERETLELPAGARDSVDEDTRVTAARELLEETGMTCGKLTLLTRLRPAPAWCSEFTDVYLAEDLTREGEQDLDDAEEIGLEPWDLSELCRRIYAGELQDAKTVAGILAYSNLRFMRDGR